MKSKTEKISNSGTRSIEQLSHFRCGVCKQWWSIGDAPKTKKVWHCPWCGEKQILKNSKQ